MSPQREQGRGGFALARAAGSRTRGHERRIANRQGIGPTEHSIYLNLVNIDTDGKIIVVAGNEANGRYVEHLDIQTGKKLANKKLDADTKSLLRDRLAPNPSGIREPGEGEPW